MQLSQIIANEEQKRKKFTRDCTSYRFFDPRKKNLFIEILSMCRYRACISDRFPRSRMSGTL